MRDRLKSGECSRYLKALADEDRLRIVQCLRAGPRTVGEVSRELEMPLANASHHLLLLRSAGLLTSRKQGRYVAYSLAPGVLRQRPGSAPDVLELGCCRIELGRR